MDLKFQRAKLNQRDTISRLMVRAFTPYVQTLKTKVQAGPYPDLDAGIKRGDVYVAVDDRDIVGVIEIKLAGDVLMVEQVSVDPSRQGDGIGSWILERTEELARRLGAGAITLYTAEMMTDLLRFYARHGFMETGRGLPPHGHDNRVRVFLRKDL